MVYNEFSIDACNSVETSMNRRLQMWDCKTLCKAIVTPKPGRQSHLIRVLRDCFYWNRALALIASTETTPQHIVFYDS